MNLPGRAGVFSPVPPDHFVLAIRPVLHNVFQHELHNFRRQFLQDVERIFTAKISEALSQRLPNQSTVQELIAQQLTQAPQASQTWVDVADYIKIVLNDEQDRLKFVKPAPSPSQRCATLNNLTGAHWKDIEKVRFFNPSKQFDENPYLIINVKTRQSGKTIRDHFAELSTALGLTGSCTLVPYRYTVHVKDFDKNLIMNRGSDLAFLVSQLRVPPGSVTARFMWDRVLLDTEDLSVALFLSRGPILLEGRQWDCIPFPAEGNPLFCHKCWGTGHFEKNCDVPEFRCGRCADNHSTYECQSTHPLCCNCAGDHPAWDVRCTAPASKREHDKSAFRRKVGPEWGRLVAPVPAATGTAAATQASTPTSSTTFSTPSSTQPPVQSSTPPSTQPPASSLRPSAEPWTPPSTRPSASSLTLLSQSTTPSLTREPKTGDRPSQTNTLPTHASSATSDDGMELDATALTDAAPTGTTPTDTTPTDTIPIDTTPTDTIPIETPLADAIRNVANGNTVNAATAKAHPRAAAVKNLTAGTKKSKSTANSAASTSDAPPTTADAFKFLKDMVGRKKEDMPAFHFELSEQGFTFNVSNRDDATNNNNGGKVINKTTSNNNKASNNNNKKKNASNNNKAANNNNNNNNKNNNKNNNNKNKNDSNNNKAANNKGKGKAQETGMGKNPTTVNNPTSNDNSSKGSNSKEKGKGTVGGQENGIDINPAPDINGSGSNNNKKKREPVTQEKEHVDSSMANNDEAEAAVVSAQDQDDVTTNNNESEVANPEKEYVDSRMANNDEAEAVAQEAQEAQDLDDLTTDNDEVEATVAAVSTQDLVNLTTDNDEVEAAAVPTRDPNDLTANNNKVEDAVQEAEDLDDNISSSDNEVERATQEAKEFYNSISSSTNEVEAAAVSTQDLVDLTIDYNEVEAAAAAVSTQDLSNLTTSNNEAERAIQEAIQQDEDYCDHISSINNKRKRKREGFSHDVDESATKASDRTRDVGCSKAQGSEVVHGPLNFDQDSITPQTKTTRDLSPAIDCTVPGEHVTPRRPVGRRSSASKTPEPRNGALANGNITQFFQFKPPPGLLEQKPPPGLFKEKPPPGPPAKKPKTIRTYRKRTDRTMSPCPPLPNWFHPQSDTNSKPDSIEVVGPDEI